ncbi:hypothetical protein QTH91_01750 [Variovorax dokdonensis]|uniref:Uncharacterized protein n=1 Tax=Variovorax dokdonensis TaxID=344883 RepID=A0ABT7N5K1_9BURK|nr:hypothetical protein [Variovorax dokdonensis]MDM0043195.1 hypothetical protein [Variovorax dokdonensis]
MNRCLPHALISTFLLLGALAPLANAQTQAIDLPINTQNEAAAGGRNFPPGTLRGEATFLTPPLLELDGKPTRLSPGSRIQSAQRMLVQPAALAGQSFVVNYTRDATGGLRDVWLLSAEEAGAKRAGAEKPFLNFWPFVSN